MPCAVWSVFPRPLQERSRQNFPSHHRSRWHPVRHMTSVWNLRLATGSDMAPKDRSTNREKTDPRRICKPLKQWPTTGVVNRCPVHQYPANPPKQTCQILVNACHVYCETFNHGLRPQPERTSETVDTPRPDIAATNAAPQSCITSFRDFPLSVDTRQPTEGRQSNA